MRVSIIGTGRIGVSLERDALRYKPCTHMGAVQTLIKQGEPLKWDFLCDLNEAQISQALQYIKDSKPNDKRLMEKIRTSRDYREVIAAQPDILIIAANTGAHSEIIKSAIKARVPKIIVEKPICLNYRQAMRIHHLARKFNTRIWVNYERRYHPKYQQLKKDIEKGEVYGAPLYYRGWFASSNSSLFKSGPDNEGVLLHDTTHLVDLAQFLFGDINSAQRSLNKADIHKMNLVHQNGISGEILTTIDNMFFHFEFEIFFEYARVKVGNGFTIIEKAEKSKHYMNFTSLGSPRIIPDKKMQIKNNPFLKLYSSVIHDEYETSFLKDACQNIKYLT